MRIILARFIAVTAFAMTVSTAMADGLASMSPAQIVAQLASAVTTGDDAAVSAWLTVKARADLAELENAERATGRLAAIGSPLATTVAERTERPDGTTLRIDVVCSGGTAHWTVAFDDAQGLLDAVRVESVATAPPVVERASAHVPDTTNTDARAKADAERQKQAEAVEGTLFTEPLGPAPEVPAPSSGSPSAPLSPLGWSSPLHHHHAFAKPHRITAGTPAASGHPPAASASRSVVLTEPPLPPVVAAEVARPVPTPPPPPGATSAPDVPPSPAAPTAAEPPVSPPASDVVDARTVEFLLATTRKAETGGPLRFTADRSDSLLYGVVRVHVPIDHKAGHVERPWSFSPAGFTLYEEKLDEKKHFVVTGARLIGADDFFRFATGDPRKEALVFIHGFNNTFEDSAYRFAQILFDLQYNRPAILFSWASKGSSVDYLYDKDSAEEARDRFAALIRTLQSQGVEKIDVIAHSMGNYLAVTALADSVQSAAPDRVEQLIMAAPDISRDYLSLEAPKLAKIAHAVTLYACATDRALQLSKDAAGGIPRAGDVPPDGPLVIPGIDTIDVSLLGGDWFGLNHDVFASNRSVMDDIFALLNDEKPPPRLAQVRGMPDGVVPPRFWRFEP